MYINPPAKNTIMQKWRGGHFLLKCTFVLGSDNIFC